MKQEQRSVGFYSLNNTEDKEGYLGAVLVTDEYGRPLEFRVTYPLQAQRLSAAALRGCSGAIHRRAIMRQPTAQAS